MLSDMKKKTVCIVSVSLAITFLYSCTLPSAVQVNADNFEVSVPLRTEADFSSMFRGILEDAFDGEETYAVRIFDMVDVGPAMTFLVAFEFDEMLPSFNPSDYLASFAGQYIDGISPIEVNIPVPDLSWSSGGIEVPLSYLPDVPLDNLVGAVPIRVPLPRQVADAIEAAYDEWDLTGGFLNADAGQGSFVGLTATFRPAGSGLSVPLSVSGQISVSQEAAFEFGESFDGLSKPWVFAEGAPHYLQGSSLNGNPIKVDTSESYLYLGFENIGQSLAGGAVIIEMEIGIGRLDLVRLDPRHNDDFAVDPIEVDFATMHGHSMSIADFIQEITFGKTEMSVNFSSLHEALDKTVALAVTSDALGFDGEPEDLTWDTTFTGMGGTLNLDGIRMEAGNENEIEAIIKIEVELVPPNGKYFAIGPIDIGGNGYLYAKATIGFDFEWESAKINTAWIDEDLLGGSILDDPINLEDTFGDLMSGFAFAEDSLEIHMFLDGASGILRGASPTLTLNAVFDELGTDKVQLFAEQLNAETLGALPELPDGASWYGGLPDGDGGLSANMGDFINKINDGWPAYMRFFYEVAFGGDDDTIRISPDMFAQDEDGEVRIMVMMKLALDFNVSNGAHLSLPLFEDSEDDIFGRDHLGDSLFGNDSLDIRMLMLRLEFYDSAFDIFEGTVLHLDANNRLFPDGLPLNDGTNGNLNVRIEGNDFDIIHAYLIPPDVRIVYPWGRNVKITRYLQPARITMAVSGSYRLEL